MPHIIVPSRRIWTRQPQQVVEIDRANTFGARCDFSWLASNDAKSAQKIVTNQAIAANFTTQIGYGKSNAVAARPFTVVLVMAFPVPSVGGGYGIYVGSGNGFRLDVMTTGGGIYAGWTANGVANGVNSPWDASGVFDMRPVVLVSDWTAAGQTSWWQRQGMAPVSWSDSLGYNSPSDTTVYLGQDFAGAERMFAAYILKGNVGEAGARELLRNPWQIFRQQVRRSFFDMGAGGGSTLNASASGGDVASGSASLSAQVALASVGVSTASGSAALAASVPLSAVGLSVASGSAAPSATVTISASGLAQAAGQAGLSASVLAQAAGAAEASGNAELAAQLDALATGAAQAGGSASLSGGALGDISASGAAIASGTAVLSVTVGLQAAGSALASGTAAGSANAPGQVSAAGGAVAGGSGVMSAQVSITAAGFVQSMGQGAFSATVPLSAFGAVTASGYARLTVDNGVVMVRAPSGYRTSLIAYNSMRPWQSITIRPISLNTRR